MVFYHTWFSAFMIFSPSYLTLCFIHTGWAWSLTKKCSSLLGLAALVLAEPGAQMPLHTGILVSWSAGLGTEQPQHQGLQLQSSKWVPDPAAVLRGWSVLVGGHKGTQELVQP